jgi:hypothetical protein
MKRNSKILCVLLAVITVLMVTGCGPLNQPDLLENEVVNNTTPYADISQLTLLAEVEGNVNWKIARFFALESLENFRQANDWDGAVLSERPLVIYRASDETPRYYEFRVIKKGEEVGAIACVVEKSEGDAVQYVLPFATQVSTDNARSVNANQSKLIDAGYPKTMRVRTTSNGRSVDTGTGLEVPDDYFTDLKIRDLLEQLDPSDLALYGITSQEIYDRYIAIQQAEEERIQTFWEKVYEAEEEILNLSEEEILKIFSDDAISARATLLSENQWILWDWYNKGDWNQPVYDKLWCGPMAMYFVTLGFGSASASGYSGFPQNKNDQVRINAMYKAYESRTINTADLFYGATTFIAMDNALRALTNYSLHSPLLPSLHLWSYSHSSIKSAGLPVVSLRSGKTLFGSWHYRTIIGTCRQEYKQKYTILGLINWYDYYNTDWYLMMDVGVDGDVFGKPFWEKAGQLYQLQTCKVQRK